METFKASNGRQIETDSNDEVRIWEDDERGKDHNMLKGYSYLNGYDIDALRELFLHERDQELGRWRDPESPERFVVPRGHDGWVQVWNEADPRCEGIYTRSSAEIHLSNPEYPCAATAKRYFAAHPEPKPWHDAKPGEVWVMTIDGSGWTAAAYLREDGRWRWAVGGFVGIDDVVSARRIWPEVVSDG